jgi:hypothetical protein
MVPFLVLQYPDLVVPHGWHHLRVGPQIRLVPPDAPVEEAEAVIILSPLVPRTPEMLDPESLIQETLDMEIRQRFEVLSQSATQAIETTTGLKGVFVEVSGYARPKALTEKRVYVVYADALVYYGVSYLASDTGYGRQLKVFWECAKSLRPFRGKAIPPVALRDTF